LVRLCLAATLWFGFAAQQHALAHALSSLHAPAPHDVLAGHAQACEQCLQFAAAHAAAVPTVLSWQPPAAQGHVDARIAPPRRAEAFTAYTSRAPPPRA
jgi:hypothetical protein